MLVRSVFPIIAWQFRGKRMRSIPFGAKGCGLACAIGADQIHDLVRAHAEAHVLHRSQRVVLLGQPLHFDHAARSCSRMRAFLDSKKETATLQSPFPCAVSGAAGAYRTTNTTAVRGGTVKRPLTRS